MDEGVFCCMPFVFMNRTRVNVFCFPLSLIRWIACGKLSD